MRKALLLAQTALLGLAAGLPAVALPPSVKVSSLTFDGSLLINLYNAAQQNNNQITSYDAGPNAGVLVAVVTNTGGSPIQPCFIAYITDPSGSYSCGASPLATSPLIQSKRVLQPGETASLNISDFQVVSGAGYNGALCSNFQTQLTNQFGTNPSPSSVGQAVHTFLTKHFTVCLAPANNCSTKSYNASLGACTDMVIFTPPTGTDTCAMIVYPHNNGVPTANPIFSWTPAYHQGRTDNMVYRLVISQTENADEWWFKDGIKDTFYQYGLDPHDKPLDLNRKYWFHIVSHLPDGTMVGGQAGQGWNIEKWFQIQVAAPVSGAYTKQELDAFARQQLLADPSFKNLDLLGATIDKATDESGQDVLGTSSDSVSRLVKGSSSVTITGIKVTNQ